MTTLSASDRKAAHDLLLELSIHLLSNGGFLGSNGGECGDYTQWNICNECFQADWEGHKPGCRTLVFVERIKAMIEKLK